MWERLVGVQVGGLWASVQALEIAAAIVAIALIASKIHDKVTGDDLSNEEEGK